MARRTLLSLTFAVTAGILAFLPVTTSRAAAPAARTLAATRTVDTGEYYFGPATLTISVGDTVTWTNSGREGHTINPLVGSAWGTDDLEPGQSYSFTFTAPGTYNYTCVIHDNQDGTIVVQ